MLTIIFFIRFFFFFLPQPQDDVPKEIYDFKVTALNVDGSTIDFSEFKGKMILIVNTASQCVNTPQLEELENIYRQYHQQLVVVGFPTNDFGNQDPGSNKDIAFFCSRAYGVTFPMAAKIAVKGKDMALIYKWLTAKKYNHFKDSKIKWNFQKYLLDEKGHLEAIFDPEIHPSDTINGIIPWINQKYAKYRKQQ